MKKLLQRLDLKRKVAALMAVIITTMAFLPYIPYDLDGKTDPAQVCVFSSALPVEVCHCL